MPQKECAAGERQGTEQDGRHKRDHQSDDAHRARYGPEPVPTKSDDPKNKETQVLRKVRKGWEPEERDRLVHRHDDAYQVARSRQHQDEEAHGQVTRRIGDAPGGLYPDSYQTPPDDIAQAEDQEHLRKPERPHSHYVGKLLPGERGSQVSISGRSLIEGDRSNGAEHKHIGKHGDAQAQQAVFGIGSWSLTINGVGREVARDQEKEAHKVSLIQEQEYDEQPGHMILWGRRLHEVEG